MKNQTRFVRKRGVALTWAEGENPRRLSPKRSRLTTGDTTDFQSATGVAPIVNRLYRGLAVRLTATLSMAPRSLPRPIRQ